MSKSMIDKSISNQLYVVKALSIFSVICAHMRIFNFNQQYDVIIDRIYASIGTIGVICFLFISGFFYNQNEDMKIFWKKKIKSIILRGYFVLL